MASSGEVPPPDPWAAPAAPVPAPPSAAPGPAWWAGPPGSAAALPPWPSGGWGAPPPPPTTNGWAVVALVTGLVALVPVAVAAGVVALVQTSRRPQAGSGLAVAGLVLAAIWTVLGGLVLLGSVLAGELRLGRVADVGTTSAGTCLRLGSEPGEVAVPVPCDLAHDGEVYRVDTLLEARGEPWPGADETDLRADDACYAAFRGYVGRSYETSEHDYGYYLPDRAEWADGERRVVCVVVLAADDRRGAVRGTAE